MLRYVIVSIVSGVVFGILDGVINGNPMAQRLFQVYQPIARTSFNLFAGILIDLAYGFIMAGVFLVLFRSLPGETNLVKGLSFGILVWFFRVVMYNASHWVMFNVPVPMLLYSLACGLVEMIVLGVLYGLTLKPAG